MKKITVESVKDFVFNNSDCILVSETYKGAHFTLVFKCKCGEVFESSYSNFKNSNKRQCNTCGTYKLSKINCKNCNEEFRPRNSKTKFCNLKCKSEFYENKIEFKCNFCEKTNNKKPSSFYKAERSYCNKECYDKDQDKKVKYRCNNCNKECEATTSKYNKYKYHFCSNECSGEFKKSNTITDEQREQGRFRKADKKWANDIKEKYNLKCCVCKNNNKIVAHHLDGWNYKFSSRTSLENGVCLCELCHKDFHSKYGYGNNTKQQFLEYLNQANTEVTICNNIQIEP